jgi:hypothetical protein
MIEKLYPLAALPPGTHCMGGHVDLRDGLVRDVRRKILVPAGN